jgi:hypothetical protein
MPPKPPYIIKISESDMRAMLAEGFHTAFRKAIDSPLAMPIHRLIGELPDDDWAAVLDFVMSGFKSYRTEE